MTVEAERHDDLLDRMLSDPETQARMPEIDRLIASGETFVGGDTDTLRPLASATDDKES